MSLATSGHNATVAVELGAVTLGIIAAPVSGTFTSVPELRGDLLGLSATRAETNATPHGEDIDSWVTGPLVRDALSLAINYDPTNAAHLALRACFLATTPALRRRGFRFWGPNGSAGVDEVIVSGEITSWKDKSPEGAGIREVSITVRPSKQTKVDGILYGTAA